MPTCGRLLLLSISFFLFLILNTVGVGAQTADDHGNYLNNATNLPLGSSVAGRIDPGDDVDVFKLDLSGRSGPTDVWIYTTGELNSAGGLYYSSGGQPFAFNDDSFISGRRYNFHLRATLAPAIYYVGVFSFDGLTTGSYTLHAEAVTDPGSTISTATRLNLTAPTPGSIDTSGDEDYFRLDLPQNANFHLYARSVYGEPVDGELFDGVGNYVGVNHFLWDDGFYIRDDIGPGTYYIQVSTFSGVTTHPVHYTIHVLSDSAYTNFLADCQSATEALNSPQINDALYACQWHLRNQNGEDINVETIWAEGIKGEGINIAVVDDGMDWNHEDLVDNVNKALNHDYTGNNDIHHPFEHHGTNVAGVLAARDNGIGVRGVAPRATIYGYNLIAADRPTTIDQADAMARNSRSTAVSNNSWGPVDGPRLGHANAFWELAVKSGVKDGYNGKGTFYVKAAGNGHLKGDDSNLDEFANFYAVTAVCAVNDADKRSNYSEKGANLWVCAPSDDDDDEYRGIITVENSDRYRDDFGGTSSAAPTVSGVVALMRQANPNLTWRDLKLILAAPARKNDPTNPGWEDGARKYDSASDRYHFNHEYGFGVVDAKAAVDMAKGWGSGLPTLQSTKAASASFNFPIPDLPATLIPSTHYHDLSLNTDIDFTEFVEVSVTFNHPSFRDLDIELESPSGAVSKLTVPIDTYTPDDPTDDDFVLLDGTFRFGSARHLGENPNGVWRLRVSDHIEFGRGTWDSWSIKVYGHSSTPVGTSECATLGAVSDATQNLGLVSDCETLLGTLDTLIGTGTALNWSASTPMTSWYGVTVEGTPARVTEVSLRNMGLRGTIPAQLGDLTALTVLDLITPTCDGEPCPNVADHERNQLTGPIPPELGNLANLRQLLLHNNQLSGGISPALGRLANLRVLALGLNQLTGPVPTELGNLASLQELYLWGNKLTGPIPTELGYLSNLQRLSLSQNQLTGTIPNSLGSLSNLLVLSLSQNRLTGPIPESLGDLSKLQVLSLWSNQLTGTIPTSLIKLANLEELYLSQNQFTGCIPAALQNVPTNDLADVILPFCVSPSVTLSITSTSVLVRINSPIPVTATFSEPVFGFTVGDITVNNGSAGNFVGNNGDLAYTFDVTPNAIGVVTVDIAEDLAVDAEGNGNTAAPQLSLGLIYDDNRDGKISLEEAVNAVRDYFLGVLTIEQAIAVIQLYFISGF